MVMISTTMYCFFFLWFLLLLIFLTVSERSCASVLSVNSRTLYSVLFSFRSPCCGVARSSRSCACYS
uniref:Secreted protein n=1 Tax=Anguilla anguilla TaxID=7936 RepID=A0A0E9W9J8_ANGAN